ncbi:hypothetical protein HDV05_007147, partial [Chytridiales sp. JEL 0842]
MSKAASVPPVPMGLFNAQPKLARLPIPPLKETAERYLKSVKAIATPTQYAETEKAVAEFIKPGGLGETLQTRLQAYDKTQAGSWLEQWWLQLAYLGWRDSVLINSNWYLYVVNHHDCPKELLTEGHPSRVNGDVTSYQMKRVTGAIQRFLDYKDLIDSERLPPEATKNGYLCMNQHRYLFGITRVPKPTCDVIVGQHPAHAKHIVVSFKDQFYSINVYDVSGARISMDLIEKQLWAVVQA